MHATATIKLRACLRMHAACCVDLDGNPGLLLALRDTTGMLQDDLTASWIGGAAIEFMRQHLREMVAGRCLDLELHHLRARACGDMRARVKACALAPLPPSWIKHASLTTPINAYTPAHPRPSPNLNQSQPKKIAG